MRRGVFLTLAGLLCVSTVCATAGIGYILMRDEALQALGSRQAKIERSYEDHIASLRRELDKVNSQRLMEEAALESRLRDLAHRQQQIEQQALMLSSVAARAGVPVPGENSSKAVRSAQRPSPPPAPRAATAPAAPGVAVPALSFAPAAPPVSSAASAAGTALEAVTRAAPAPGVESAPSATVPTPPPAPRPGLRGAFIPAHPTPEQTAEIAPSGNLAGVVASLARVEDMQVGVARMLGHRAREEAQKLESLAANLGIGASRLLTGQSPASAQGGPYVPLTLDPNGSPFHREMLRQQEDILRADRLRRGLASAPLGRPVSGDAEQTSGFGSRIDPFLGRPAFHTGIDFREAPGAPVFATAPGVVVSAGSNGGYGLMVELDHGNGISTRYAHLSAITVSEGQTVPARHVIGRVGSTGRSTGPHLHYEVRVDDDAVDPSRFLRAGAALAAQSAGTN
jgi:murein DD-endopeptidase MepM/ murein hydrolase activator NlpD